MDKLHKYVLAARIRNSKLTDVIAENLIVGSGIGSAISHGISQKIKASTLGFKEKFDPLNMLSALVGRNKLGTALAGRLLGRNGQDVRYFANKNNYRNKNFKLNGPFKGSLFDNYNDKSQHKSFRLTPKKDKTKDPLVLTAIATNSSNVRNGETIANIFGKIYILLLKNYSDRKKYQELDDSFRKVADEKDEERHQKLLEAIQGKHGGTPTATKVKKSSGFDLFGTLGMGAAIGLAIVGVAALVTSVAAAIASAVAVLGLIIVKITEFIGKVAKDLGEIVLKGLSFFSKEEEKLTADAITKTSAKKVEQMTVEEIAKAESKAIEEQGGKVAAKVAADLEKTAATKLSEKVGTKVAGKLTKSIMLKHVLPVVSLGLGAKFSYDRFKQGDIQGGILEAASGILGAVPLTMAASLAIDAALIDRDIRGSESIIGSFTDKASRSLEDYIGNFTKLSDNASEYIGDKVDNAKNVGHNIWQEGMDAISPKYPIQDTPTSSQNLLNNQRINNESKTRVKGGSGGSTVTTNNNTSTPTVEGNDDSSTGNANVRDMYGIDSSTSFMRAMIL